MRLFLATELPISAPTAWDLARKPALLRHVTRGMLGFRGTLPPVWREGETVTVRLLALGVLPLNLHTLRLVRLDPVEGVAVTEESGGAVRRWRHVIRIEPLGPDRCRYSDDLDFDAGGVTALVWLYAAAFYRYRQARWRALARVLA